MPYQGVRLLKPKRRFTLHFGAFNHLLHDSFGFSIEEGCEMVQLLRGRFEAWLTEAYDKGLFSTYTEWQAEAVLQPLFHREQFENWTDHIHLVLFPVLDHKLGADPLSKRLQSTASSEGMSTLKHLCQAGRRSVEEASMVVQSLQWVGRGFNPLSDYLSGSSDQRFPFGKYYSFCDVFVEIDHTTFFPSAGSPLIDYGTSADGTAYWRMKPVLDRPVQERLTVEKPPIWQWFAPCQREITDEAAAGALGTLDIVCVRCPPPPHLTRSTASVFANTSERLALRRYRVPLPGPAHRDDFWLRAMAFQCWGQGTATEGQKAPTDSFFGKLLNGSGNRLRLLPSVVFGGGARE